MLTFFTDPYPNELLYSACARYHYYIGNIDYKDTLEELFGKRSIIPNFYMGSYLNYLVEELGNKYDVDQLIAKHTLFPFYAPFLPDERKKELIVEMKYQSGENLYTKLGVVAGSICKKEGIYYCYECATGDIGLYGEAYIHREHQLQGVIVCPHHGTYLQNYEISKRNTSRLEFIRLDEEKLINQNIEYPIDSIGQGLQKIAILAYQLLQYPTEDVNKDRILKLYKKLLNEKGLAAPNGTIRQQDLYSEFMNFYDKKLLEVLESVPNNEDEYNWLRVITRNLKRTVHPIRHLLLINFLVGDINAFFKQLNNDYNPFGKGPWPCLNRVANHYGKEIIENIEITPDYKTRLPVGTFRCSCGFAYSRKGPDKLPQDKYKIGRIKEFGDEWDDKLKEHLKATQWSLRGIAREMHCDPKTILKKDRELGIYVFNSCDVTLVGNEKKAQTKADTSKLEEYKKVIIEVRASNSSLTRTEIRNLIKKEYMYVYREDKQWLFEHLPKCTKATKAIKTVDWEKRDKEILRLVKVKYKELLIREKPIRITKSLIGKELGISALLEKKKEKLPNTSCYLKQILEGVETFQTRRCKVIIEKQKQEGTPIRLWEVQKIAGIRNTAFNNIKEALEKYINQS